MLGPLHGIPPSQHQQNQNQQPNQQPQDRPGIPLPPPQNGQDYTLSSVLHFLQTEWRRYERERNEWEIERAEMRARIALLEGERRSFDNVKLDLMKRIKMLEYALRMERSKQLSQSSPSIPAAKLVAGAGTGTQAGQVPSQSRPEDANLNKDDSGPNSPHSEDSPLPNSRATNGGSSDSTRPQSWGGVLNPAWASINGNAANASLAGVGKPPLGRDPRSRARSREYLKQCLQEITYLTSPQAMNPLPNRPLLNNQSLPMTMPNVQSFDPAVAYNGRPRKVMPDTAKDFPMMNGAPGAMPLMSGPSSAPASGGPLERPNPMGSSMMLQQHLQQQQQQYQQQQMQQGQAQGPPQHHLMQQRQGRQGSPPQSQPPQAVSQAARPIAALESQSERDNDEDEGVAEPEAEDEELLGSGESNKSWKAKRTLRNHLDAVRAVTFHPTELCLATGSDDCTVKVWRMDVAHLATSAARPAIEVEPQLTLRGHSAAVTRIICSPSRQLLYSASLDSSIRIWALPPPGHTTYASYDETRARGELIGHTDAVWDLALVHDEGRLISCGAEGAVKVWDVSGNPVGGGALKLTWGWNGIVENHDDHDDDESLPGATAVEALKTDLKQVAVAYQNAIVKIFDIDTGKELNRLATDMTYGKCTSSTRFIVDGTTATQINRIVSHPTSPLLVTAHEDKFIRIFDLTTGQCTYSMLAHLDGVTSLSIDAAGLSLVSGSHDCSIRFWDLMGSRACTQEITTHREKAREGVLDVQFHPSLPVMVSAGADGVVKLYTSS
ncbi:WD40 repeat-like protein [Fistulina hepatica ATCC 64428]|nr:WD40 repeat-like protein [Fistulina hepatica ATCC 64428]